jgi:hypothetical protein
LLRRVLAIQTGTLGSEHEVTGINHSKLGRVLVRQGKYAAAIPELEEARRIFALTRSARNFDSLATVDLETARRGGRP